MQVNPIIWNRTIFMSRILSLQTTHEHRHTCIQERTNIDTMAVWVKSKNLQNLGEPLATQTELIS